MKLFYHFYFLIVLLFISEKICCQNIDIDLVRKINVERNHHLDEPMKFISNSEGIIGVGIPVSICAVAMIKKDKNLLQKGVNITFALAANTLTTFALKRVVNRDRPSLSYPYIQAFESEQHFSFPSGHTSNAFCDATSLSLNFRKWYVIAPAYGWACVVGYSRMHLGMHYPSDVLCGAIIGAASAWTTYKVNKWIKQYYIKKFAPLVQ